MGTALEDDSVVLESDPKSAAERGADAVVMAPSTVGNLVAASLFSEAVAALSPTIDPEIIILADTPEQWEMAEWALGRYHIAGLELPPLTVVFAGPNLTECDGACARVHLDETPILVKMCWNDRFMLLHELAHIWEAHNVPASKHEPFAAMRTEVESWASLDVPWDGRGREHAANVIAWGLLEDPLPVSRTYPNDPDHLREAFQFLTGKGPLHDGGTPIEEPDREFFSPDRANPPLESGQ